MRILCDEHVPPAVVNALGSEGLDVQTVVDVLDAGTTDETVGEYAAQHGLVLLTNDSDFVDDDPDHGVLYYDDQAVSNRDLVRAVRVVADLFGDVDFTGQLVHVPDGWI